MPLSHERTIYHEHTIADDGSSGFSQAEATSLLEKVRSLDPWFYPVRIGPVEVSPGKGTDQPVRRLYDRTLYREHLLVSAVAAACEVRGRRILDLGCNIGYWAARYVQLGATEVVGVEGRERALKQAELYWHHDPILASATHEFILGDVSDDAVWLQVEQRGAFDLTLCCGLLYHVEDYRQVLRRAASVTREAMVIDTRVTTGNERETPEPGDLCFNGILDGKLRTIPKVSNLLDCVRSLGFKPQVLKPRFPTPKSLPRLDDYGARKRMAVLAQRERRVDAGRGLDTQVRG